MANKSFEECMDKILECIERRRCVDYGDKASVRRYNSAYTQMRRNAEYISNFHSGRINDFLRLVYHADCDIAFACACLVIQWIDCSGNQKRQAIDVVKKLTNEGKLDNVTRFALCNGVIDQWEKTFCGDSP